MSNYDINSIESLSFKEGVRRRIQMYLGSATTEGLWQGLKEIINNSTDEALAGYGKQIVIKIKEKEQEFSVRDFGRSVPFGFRENGENVLVSIFSSPHTGGKFEHDAYLQATGCNGVGASATCLSSKEFKVKSYRNGVVATAIFVDGENTFYEETKTDEETGTYISYTPSKDVFKDVEEPLTYKRICEEIENISYLNNGIKFIVINEDNGDKKEFYSENGISDFIINKVKNPLMKKPILCSKKDETDEVEIALIWTKDKEQSYCFVNGGFCNMGGSPVTGAKTAITNSLKKFIGKDIEPELFRRGLCYVINCKVPNPSFEGQTKNRIYNINLRELARQAVTEGLERFSKTQEFKKISEIILSFQKAEKAAEKARNAILTQNKEIEKELKKKVILADKLADCRYHNEKSQLLVCEGHSAKGALVKARSSDYTACFELMGKLINTLKNEEEKIDNNKEIRQLHIALGCGIGDKFNIKKLRYGRIVICADMDKDGYAIVCLVLTFFYTHYPELIKQGKIYWGITPLFKIETKNKIYYAYNEEELKTMPAGTITRLKGLGESTPEDFRNTIFSANSRMVKFTMKDAEAAHHYFDILLGTNIEQRKDYIFSHVDFETLED